MFRFSLVCGYETLSQMLFSDANQQCFAVGVGRTVVLLDESKFSEIRRFDTSEMLQSVRFVRSNSQVCFDFC